jgi:hypothetical protein
MRFLADRNRCNPYRAMIGCINAASPLFGREIIRKAFSLEKEPRSTIILCIVMALQRISLSVPAHLMGRAARECHIAAAETPVAALAQTWQPRAWGADRHMLLRGP